MNDTTIMHVVPRIHELSSGPTYSVMKLCESQAELGAEVELHVCRSAGQQGRNYSISTHGSQWYSGKLLASTSLKRSLACVYDKPRVVHNHSLWMMPNIYPRLIPRQSILVCSPRGTMSDWAWGRSYWIKRIAWLMGQKQMLKRCDCFHATAEHEYQDIRRRGFRQPVAVIPNGIDVPELLPKVKSSEARNLVFLARLHPVKGIECLIKSWQVVAPRFPNWNLKIAGDGSPAYEKQLRDLAARLAVPRLEFCGPLYGTQKSNLFTNADLYVLPSYTENFGVSIAEAMAHAVPVITTNATPWTNLSEKNSGWCIPTGEDALTDCLLRVLTYEPGKLAEMGKDAREWMRAEFSWIRIAKQSLRTYAWLGGRGDRPDWIID